MRSPPRAQDRRFTVQERRTAGCRAVWIPAALMSAAFALTPGASPAEAPEPASARAHYDLDDGGLALQGYDPVAYFVQGEAVEGDPSIEIRVEGVTYRFASASHRDAFAAEPDRFRPAYGGWCAWAVAEGGKTRPDPTNFIVSEGRLFLFFKNFLVDTKKKWQRGDPAALEGRADDHWAAWIGS